VNVDIHEIDGCAVITVHAECLDAGNVQQFKKRAQEIIAGHAHIVIDITPVRFIDSAGLGAMLSCLRMAHANGGKVALTGVTGSKQTLFQIVRMDRIFDVFPTPEAAARNLSKAE
jgi:anti-sigma B factor antagonist